jgi:aryl-alcohol dehydrogenase-like predicted oxidoreductase
MEVTALIEGRATPEGTRRFQKRFARQHESHFYRQFADGPMVSSLGLGTYLGECDDAEDARYTTTAVAAIGRGVNLIDTAVNYRCQRSERAIGDALRAAVGSGAVGRDEIVVCTKGGYVPLDRTPPATREDYHGFLEEKYFQHGVMQPSDVVAGGHCLTPRYLEDQIERSRTNLGLELIDVYFVHNPEQQLEALDRPAFLDVMRNAFAALESQAQKGTIGVYGCASWNGFRVSPDAKTHLALDELVAIARDVGGENHHFKVVQLPINLAMTEAVRSPTQCVDTNRVPFLEAARHFTLSVVGSATLMQSQLATSLPPQVKAAFPGFETDARRAIAFSQSLPIATALVGMRSVKHLEQNLARGKSR